MLLGLIILVGLLVRVLFTPYSAGSDLAQFHGFAETFIRHGLCFYSYSCSGNWASEGWPYDWPYVYGPVWMYILGFLAHVTRGGVEASWVRGHYYVYIDPAWIVAVKTVLIAADTADALILYFIASRRSRGVTPIAVTALYYLNPMTIYISSIYGMFDQLALFFVLTALALYSRERLPPFLLGFAASVKQTALPVLASLLLQSVKDKRLVRFSAYAAAGLILPFLPILVSCPTSLIHLLGAVDEAGEPHYTLPLAYSFNGVSSLATYMHLSSGGSYMWLIRIWPLPFTLLSLYLAIKIVRNDMHPLVVAALSYAVFTATYWRINHQYLVPLIALALAALPLLDRRGKILSLILVFWIGLWPIAFPTSWWFHVHIRNPNTGMIRFIDRITLMVFDDRFYVAYSVILTFLQYVFILYAAAKTRTSGEGYLLQDLRNNPAPAAIIKAPR